MIDIDELRKLSVEAKLDIIFKLADTIDDDWQSEIEEEIDPEVLKEMERRLDDMKSGRAKTYTWEDVKEKLLDDVKARKLNKS